MKTTRFTSRACKPTFLSAILLAGLAIPAQAVVVSISGTSITNDQPIINFLTTNFTNITSVNYGDYSNPANIPVGTDVFMVGRSLSSNAYNNATNSAAFNALTIPVVSFTSFVTRTNGSRWSWESGDSTGAFDPTGNETTVTAAGASVFGIAAGPVDFITSSGSEFGLGQGTVGTGSILATITTDLAVTGILAAGWMAGEQSAGGATFGGNRLLWNAFQDGSVTLLPDNADGQQALRSAVAFYTGLTPVPEPSAAFLGALGALALLHRRRA